MTKTEELFKKEASSHHPLLKELSAIVGSEYVSDDPLVLYTYASDVAPMPKKIQGIVVRPASIEEVVHIVKLANATRTPIMPCGSRASIYGATPGSPGRSIVLDTRRMDKIVTFDEKNLLVTAQAGITAAELETRVREKGWGVSTCLQPWYADTIGGMLSGGTGGGGSLRESGDTMGWNVNGFINSVKVVLGTGDVIESAAAANFGRGIPYAKEPGGPCMTPMFLGDCGTFGIKVEATFRIWKLREEWAKEGESAYFDSEDQAFACYVDAAMWEPNPSDMLVMMSPYTAKNLLMGKDKWMMSNMWQGVTKDHHEATRKWWRALVKKHGAEIATDPATKFMAERMATSKLFYEMGAFGSGNRIYLIEAACPFSECQECFHILRSEIHSRYDKAGVTTLMSEVQLAMANQHVASVFVWYDDSDPKERQLAIDTFRDVWKIISDRGWSPDLTHGFAAKMMGNTWKPSYLNYMRALKHSLDPNNIMNPGAWGDAI